MSSFQYPEYKSNKTLGGEYLTKRSPTKRLIGVWSKKGSHSVTDVVLSIPAVTPFRIRRLSMTAHGGSQKAYKEHVRETSIPGPDLRSARPLLFRFLVSYPSLIQAAFRPPEHLSFSLIIFRKCQL